MVDTIGTKHRAYGQQVFLSSKLRVAVTPKTGAAPSFGEELDDLFSRHEATMKKFTSPHFAADVTPFYRNLGWATDLARIDNAEQKLLKDSRFIKDATSSVLEEACKQYTELILSQFTLENEAVRRRVKEWTQWVAPHLSQKQAADI